MAVRSAMSRPCIMSERDTRRHLCLCLFLGSVNYQALKSRQPTSQQTIMTTQTPCRQLLTPLNDTSPHRPSISPRVLVLVGDKLAFEVVQSSRHFIHCILVRLISTISRHGVHTLCKNLARHAGKLVGEGVQQLLQLGRKFSACVIGRGLERSVAESSIVGRCLLAFG